MLPQTGLDPVPDFVKDALDWVGDTFSDIIDRVPGSKWVEKWAVDFYKGQLQDFAKSKLGQIALRGVAASLSTGAMALGWALANSAGPPFGPILGIVGNSISISLAATPGILRGDRFDQALITEWGWRIQQAVEIVPSKLGLNFDQWVSQYGNQALDEIRKISESFSAQFREAVKVMRADALAALPKELQFGTQEASDWLTRKFSQMDPVELAKKYGLRSDAVELARAALTKQSPNLGKYDLLSGKPLIATSQTVSIPSGSVAAQLSRPGMTTQASSVLKGSTAVSTPYASRFSTSVAQQLQKGSLVQAQPVPSVPNIPLLRDSFTAPSDEESFWDKYKLWLLGGAGVVAVGGILLWSRKR